MKFFIFTCLLAAALAQNIIQSHSSSEESANIFQEKFKHYKNVATQPSEASLSSLSSEESTQVNPEKVKLAYEKQHIQEQLNKINKLFQKLNLPKYLPAVQQQPIVDPENFKIAAYPLGPIVESASHSQKESVSYSQKESADSSSSEESTHVDPEKIHLVEENQPIQNQLNKINKIFQKLSLLLKHLQPVQQQQLIMSPEHLRIAAYPFVPIAESASPSQEESPSSPPSEEATKVINEIIELPEEEMHLLKLSNTIRQYQQAIISQYIKAIHQYEAFMNQQNHINTNAYQTVPLWFF